MMSLLVKMSGIVTVVHGLHKILTCPIKLYWWLHPYSVWRGVTQQPH